MAIIAIIGDQGDGKSTLMTHMLYEAHKNGILVNSNYTISFTSKDRIRTIEKMMGDPDFLSYSFTAVDEAHIAADSRKFFSSKNDAFTKWITQLRKRGITLIFATQRKSLVDTRLRSQCDYIFYPRKIETFVRDGITIDSLFEVIVQDPKTGAVVNEFILDAYEIFKNKLFDTTEIIDYDKKHISSKKRGVDNDNE